MLNNSPNHCTDHININSAPVSNTDLRLISARRGRSTPRATKAMSPLTPLAHLATKGGPSPWGLLTPAVHQSATVGQLLNSMSPLIPLTHLATKGGSSPGGGAVDPRGPSATVGQLLNYGPVLANFIRQTVMRSYYSSIFTTFCGSIKITYPK